MPTNFETSFRLFRKLLPLVRWYLVSGTLVVMATAFLTWGNDCLSGQDDLLMVFLGSILMLTILFCLPLAIMNCLSKDYFFTVAVSVLAFFMVRAHFTVIDTLGVDNIQMQACLLFLGVCLCTVVVAHTRPVDVNKNIAFPSIKQIYSKLCHIDWAYFILISVNLGGALIIICIIIFGIYINCK